MGLVQVYTRVLSVGATSSTADPYRGLCLSVLVAPYLVEHLVLHFAEEGR